MIPDSRQRRIDITLMYFQIYVFNSMRLNSHACQTFYPSGADGIKRLDEFNSTNRFIRRFTDEFNFFY